MCLFTPLVKFLSCFVTTVEALNGDGGVHKLCRVVLLLDDALEGAGAGGLQLRAYFGKVLVVLLHDSFRELPVKSVYDVCEVLDKLLV